jgi:hypothetical protein
MSAGSRNLRRNNASRRACRASSIGRSTTCSPRRPSQCARPSARCRCAGPAGSRPPRRRMQHPGLQHPAQGLQARACEAEVPSGARRLPFFGRGARGAYHLSSLRRLLDSKQSDKVAPNGEPLAQPEPEKVPQRQAGGAAPLQTALAVAVGPGVDPHRPQAIIEGVSPATSAARPSAPASPSAVAPAAPLPWLALSLTVLPTANLLSTHFVNGLLTIDLTVARTNGCRGRLGLS